jgi:Amt family ammonium transporter
MHSELLEIMEIESALKLALTRQELLLYFQPIISLSRNRLEGFEALVRWQHPVRGILPPDSFIPIAEDSGMILPIGTWVMGEACRQLRAWSDQDRSLARLTMSVNVSIRQFTHLDLAAQVRQLLVRYEIEPWRLRLEITESTLIRDLDQVLSVARELKNLGVMLAIDDFGTGYSSLSYLRELPFDCLKIDRSFIAGPRPIEDSYHIVKSVTSMARGLGITVVAEGVEDLQQQAVLRDLECDNAQGFLYSRPMNAESATLWMKDQTFEE